VEKVVKCLGRELPVETYMGKLNKGITLFLSGSDLKIDIYEQIGWRGLRAPDFPPPLKAPWIRRLIKLENGLEISGIREDIDLMIMGQ
jgi:hypothetical protein